MKVHLYPIAQLLPHGYFYLMPNIQFNYLYRDAGNYKTYGSVVFANPDNHTLAHLENIIREKLIDDLWFYANEWGMPDLHTQPWDNDLDHTFHEFEGLAYTDEPVSEGRERLF